ncbi:5-bromo-4-chloroindolyl phosphate hydrolysis family protein [Pseudoroseicyclus sp. CXY001]|uniref:5-bromo-4-chloroindolyl phosphate hydrolysis family protein n=1 Tax=Pseudoroseicyclus sp. CXY001 TaxID=3242492 RepID=UPI003570D8DD
MAREFGGRYSPQVPKAGQKPPAEAARRQAVLDEAVIDQAGAGANLLYLPAVLLLVTSFFGGAISLLAGLAGSAMIAGAAWLMREGLRAEAAWNARPAARRPALPRKILASLLLGLGTLAAGFAHEDGLAGPALYGLAAFALSLVAFGIDPLRNKRPEGVDSFQQGRVAKVVDEAEAYLAQMRADIAALGDRQLEARVEGFEAMARRMIRSVEEDPRDLTEARRFLGVYLMGARDASVKFAELYRRRHDAGARADYEALLADLERNFGARTEKMLENDRAGMDIEIKVLRERLEREGV